MPAVREMVDWGPCIPPTQGQDVSLCPQGDLGQHPVYRSGPVAPPVPPARGSDGRGSWILQDREDGTVCTILLVLLQPFLSRKSQILDRQSRQWFNPP